jgi:hypothetical protein
MKFPRFLLIALGLLAALWLGVAQALPTVDEVQAATQRGDYAGAEKMVREVVQAKPGSARAHYLLAEILAHERKFGEAREQAAEARSLDPAIKFTDPTKFSAFEHLLEREHQLATAPVAAARPPAALPAPRAEPVASGGGVPVWVLIGGAVLFIAVAASWMRRRAGTPVTQAGPAYAGGGYAPGGYAPGGYAPGGYAPPSSGPGLMGVGLAAAGGVAAGMLAEKLLHGDRDAGEVRRGGGEALGGGGYGGFDAEAGAARDLENRDIDFGTGNGWDSGVGGGDTGGGGGDW